MPKFREIVRVGNQVGVPNNYRALMPKQRGANFKDTKYRKSLILGYIKEHEGKKIMMTDLAKAGLYSNPSGAHKLLHQMLSEGVIERVRVGRGKGSFKIREAHDYSHSNGPVTVRQAEAGYKKLAEKIVEPQEEKNVPSLAELEIKQRNVVYLARLNADMWDFLKDMDVSQTSHNTIGQTTLVLRKFAQHLTDKLKENQ